MNEFYDIAEENTKPSNLYQLANLGKQRVMATIGQPARGGYGEREYKSKTFYTATKPEDYDRLLSTKIGSTKPPYEISILLDYHLDFYVKSGGHRETFLKQVKYVVLPLLKSQRSKEVYIELLNEWLDTKTKKPEDKKSKITIVNTIKTGDINSPTQFQQNSDHSSQSQNVKINNEQLEELFSLLRADIATLKSDLKEDFKSEIDYAVKQLNKGKEIKTQLANIGSLMTNVGISVFANLIASPIFEIVKPYLGIH